MKHREIEDITDEWRKSCEIWLRRYLTFVGWKADENKTLEYLKKIKQQSSVSPTTGKKSFRYGVSSNIRRSLGRILLGFLVSRNTYLLG